MSSVNYLDDSDESDIHRYSSINQYGAFLAVEIGGVRVPIRFDKIDWIDCNGVKSHPVIISNGADNGYHYPIREYTYFTDTYLTGDRKEVIVEKLPHWFGEGWYEKALDERVFVNFDNGSLGSRKKTTLRIGLDYIQSDNVLDGSDEE